MHKRKGAFTLFELLLVIFLLALFMYLGIGLITKSEKRTESIDITNIPSFVKSHYDLSNGAVFICTNRCKECYIKTDIHRPYEKADIPVRFDQPTVYRLARTGHPEEIRYDERYDDEKICLRLSFTKYGSLTSPLIIKNENRFYFFPAFFGKARKTDSLEAAVKLWLEAKRKIETEEIL